MSDFQSPQPAPTAREAFEAALKTNPDARLWNTTDAMMWAFQAGAAWIRSVQAPEGGPAAARDVTAIFEHATGRAWPRIGMTVRLVSDELLAFVGAVFAAQPTGSGGEVPPSRRAALAELTASGEELEAIAAQATVKDSLNADASPAEAHGDERAAFEAWASRGPYYLKRADADSERYHAWMTNVLWNGWQACAASKAQPKGTLADQWRELLAKETDLDANGLPVWKQSQAPAPEHAESLAKALASAMHALVLRGDNGTSPVYQHCTKALEDYHSQAPAVAVGEQQ